MKSTNDGKRRKEKSLLSATETAKRLGISSEAVRELCKRGVFLEAYQERDNGPWKIPSDQVEEWRLSHPANRISGKHSLKWWLEKSLATIMTIITFLGVISIVADFNGAQQKLLVWGVIRPFSPAKEGEILIVIAEFDYAEGVKHTEAHNEIQRAILNAANEIGFNNLRVEIYPVQISSNEIEVAQELAKRFNASLIIWGEDTGVRVTTNLFNFKAPVEGLNNKLVGSFGEIFNQYHKVFAEETLPSYIELSETQMSVDIDPLKYSKFVTQDLPEQVAFLGFFALGQSSFAEGDYSSSALAYESALNIAQNNEQVPERELENVYMKLTLSLLSEGWSNINVEVYSFLKERENFFFRIMFDDDIMYYIRYLGDLDTNTGVEINPTYAKFSIVWKDIQEGQFKLDTSIVAFDKVIQLSNNFYKYYSSRDPETIAGYTYMEMAGYYSRGLTRILQSDLPSAEKDFDECLTDITSIYPLLHEKLPEEDVNAITGDQMYFSTLRFLYWTKSVVFTLEGDFNRAEDNLNTSLDIASFPSLIRQPTIENTLLAMVCTEQGKYESAIFLYTTILEYDSYNKEYLYLTRGLLYQKIGENEKALKDFRIYLNTAPNPHHKDKVEQWITDIEAVLQPTISH